jgi:hypothetical protein
MQCAMKIQIFQVQCINRTEFTGKKLAIGGKLAIVKILMLHRGIKMMEISSNTFQLFFSILLGI